MKDSEELDYQSFQEDVEFLIQTLKDSFEAAEARYFIDEQNDILYVRLEGLNDYTEAEIEEIALPVFEILDLDFEEIILLPLVK